MAAFRNRSMFTLSAVLLLVLLSLDMQVQVVEGKSICIYLRWKNGKACTTQKNIHSPSPSMVSDCFCLNFDLIFIKLKKTTYLLNPVV